MIPSLLICMNAWSKVLNIDIPGFRGGWLYGDLLHSIDHDHECLMLMPAPD